MSSIVTLKLSRENTTIPMNFTGIVVWPTGLKKWFKDGKKHREDGPAVQYPNGIGYWYTHGKFKESPKSGSPSKENMNSTFFFKDTPLIKRPKKSDYIEVLPVSAEEFDCTQKGWFEKLKEKKPVVNVKQQEKVPLPWLNEKTIYISTIYLGDNEPYPENFTGKIVRDSGILEWRHNGKYHRENGPAVIFPDYLSFYQYGEFRGSLPRTMFSDRAIETFKRANDPFEDLAAMFPGLDSKFTGKIIHADEAGFSCYFRGLLHHETGPALQTWDGTQKWYKHGKLHRLDGPAVENMHWNKWTSEEYWVNGIKFDLAEYERFIDTKLSSISCKSIEEIPMTYIGMVLFESGIKAWYKEGKLHRKYGPAVIFPSGKASYYQDGIETTEFPEIDLQLKND